MSTIPKNPSRFAWFTAIAVLFLLNIACASTPQSPADTDPPTRSSCAQVCCNEDDCSASCKNGEQAVCSCDGCKAVCDCLSTLSDFQILFIPAWAQDTERAELESALPETAVDD